MKKSQYVAAGALALAGLLAMTGCSSGGAGDSGSSHNSDGTSAISKVDGAGKTLTVWAMNGDYTPETLNAINKQFTKETGAKVKIQTQQWPDIVTKLTTALASSTPPDVVDSGNSQVATFGGSGGLFDVTKYRKSLEQGQTWLAGLVDPATVDGRLIAVPGFAAARTMIYNKKIWTAAGVTSTPTTYEELKADLDKIKAANPSPDFSAVYMPGMNMYANLQWLWDAGGEIATQSSGKWEGNLSSAKSQEGLKAWKDFQNTYSSVASRTLNTDNPDMAQVFADGKASAIIGNTSSQILAILKDNPKLTNDDIGSFPVPGISGKNQPAFLAGEVWGIAQKSKNHDLALVWVKIAASPDIQNNYVFGKQRWIPNSIEGATAAAASSDLPDNQKSAFIAAQRSKATPASPKWAPMELPTGLPDFFKAIASGSKSVSSAAATWDAMINSTLNG